MFKTVYDKMNICDIIKARRSVRSYTGAPLTPAQSAILEEAIAAAESPFGGKAVLKLLRKDGAEDFRPSTYGVIKGATAYLTLYVAEDIMSYISGAFMMEGVVLRATAAGLGTCWLGGTFKGSAFRTADVDDSLKLVAVLPVGMPAASTGLLDRVMRTVARSNSRKPAEELFRLNNFDTPVTADSPFALELDMMRLAPSSRNSQPWRALVHADRVDFYCTSDSAMNMLDMGIGLYHFDAAAHAQGLKGIFASDELHEDYPGGKAGYITTYILTGSNPR